MEWQESFTWGRKLAQDGPDRARMFPEAMLIFYPGTDQVNLAYPPKSTHHMEPWILGSCPSYYQGII